MILDNVFIGCSSLPTITIPNKVNTISSKVFSNCTSLTSINFEGTKEEWSKMFINPDWLTGCSASLTGVQCSDGFVNF